MDGTSGDSGRKRSIAIIIVVGVVAVAAVAAALLARPRPPRARLQLDEVAQRPESPAVSARFAAWSDIVARGRTGVVLFDSADGSKRVITPPQTDCSQPAIGEGAIVYVDHSSDDGDLYRYEIAGKQTRPFVVAPGRQSVPSADGDWVVWEDDRTGFGPRARARRLSGGAEIVVPTAKPGGVQRRPQVGNGFVVFEEYDGGVGAGDAAIYGYDLTTNRLEAIATSPTVHLLPSTDGTQVVWCEQRGHSLDVVLFDRKTGMRSSPPSAGPERTTPAVAGGRVYWVQRTAEGHLGVYSWRPGEPAPQPVPGPRSVDRIDVRAAQGSTLWLELRRSWFVHASLAGGATDKRAAEAAPTQPPADVRSLLPRARLLFAQNTVAPEPPGRPRATVAGTDSVLLTWEPSPSSVEVQAYYVYRNASPITAANIAAAEQVAIVTSPSALVPVAPNEAAVQYTLYYAVLVRDTAGHTALSDSTVPDPHGTGVGNTETCQRCHLSPSAETPVPGAKRSCYSCHGDTPATTLYGAGSPFDVQAGFHDDAATAPAPGSSQHRNSYMLDNARQCDGCHTPHRKPYSPDPAASYTMLLRTQISTATSGGSGFRYNTAAAPVGNRFCFDCHGTNLTPIALVGGPAAYLNAGGDHETGWAGTVHGSKVAAPSADPGIQCQACHDAHSSSAPALLGVYDAQTDTNRIGDTTITGDDSSACLACHSAASAGFPVYSRDASGFPVSGTWPGGATYARSIHATGGVVWPGSSYTGGACQNCHRMHGPSGRYAILRDTDANGTPGVLGFTSSDFRFCFACHDGAPGADIQRYYPVSSGGTSTVASAGHATITSGTLPPASPLPCYDCHDPHGSASAFGLLVVTQVSATQTVAIGDAPGELSMGPAPGPTAVRQFCLTCHTTADDATGWDGTTMTPVAAGAEVEGIDRVSPASRLRLPALAGHDSADTGSCYHCHGSDYSGTAGNVHAPGPGVSAAGTASVPATTAPAPTVTVPATTGP